MSGTLLRDWVWSVSGRGVIVILWGMGLNNAFTPKPDDELVVARTVVFHMRKLRLSGATEPGRNSFLGGSAKDRWALK